MSQAQEERAHRIVEALEDKRDAVREEVKALERQLEAKRRELESLDSQIHTAMSSRSY